MLLRKWEDIPEFMRNEEVKKYYDILDKKRFNLMLKRFFDIVISVLLFIILSPVFLVLAIWIKTDSSGPIFYRQERVTQYGRTFRIYKFRTMVSNADQIGSLVTTQYDSRITKVGEKIRKCRLDEIPQLINILTGDMSFVGTRPEVQKNEDEIISKCVDKGYSIDLVYIEKVLPEKMKYNLDYFKTYNILKDIKLCMKTVL